MIATSRMVCVICQGLAGTCFNHVFQGNLTAGQVPH